MWGSPTYVVTSRYGSMGFAGDRRHLMPRLRSRPPGRLYFGSVEPGIAPITTETRQKGRASKSPNEVPARGQTCRPEYRR